MHVHTGNKVVILIINVRLFTHSQEILSFDLLVLNGTVQDIQLPESNKFFVRSQLC
jgi:hypothetical protein